MSCVNFRITIKNFVTIEVKMIHLGVEIKIKRILRSTVFFFFFNGKNNAERKYEKCREKVGE